MDRFKQACWLSVQFNIARYLMSNADGRWDGAEKAQRHMELCKFYVAAVRGFDDADEVDVICDDYIAVHDATSALTDYLDEVIGFPLKGRPDYDTLGPLFFEKWHELAMGALDT